MLTQKSASLIRRNDCLLLPSSCLEARVQGQHTGGYKRATTHNKSAHRDQQLPRKSAHITPRQSLTSTPKVWFNQQCGISNSCLASTPTLQPKWSTSILLSAPSLSSSNQSNNPWGSSRGKKGKIFHVTAVTEPQVAIQCLCLTPF